MNADHSRFSGRANQYFPMSPNGLDIETGQYAWPRLHPQEMLPVVLGSQNVDQGHELRRWHQWRTQRSLPLRSGSDPKDLSQTGWGAVFFDGESADIEKALAPLFQWRRRQTGDLFKIYRGRDGYREGESKADFLARHSIGPGPVDPFSMPYYLLLVGGPDRIPFRFQYQLDVPFAVGRIAFDRPQDYAAYAENVVRCESETAVERHRLCLFGPDHADDPNTELSAGSLLRPLAANSRLSGPDWDVVDIIGKPASKERLGRLLGGGETPSLLFSAGHGTFFSKDNPRQIDRQGAIVCSDWPGPATNRPIPETQYFAAHDIGDEANPKGLIAFFFGCFTAGTPRWDEYWQRDESQQPQEMATRSFVAKLPKRLLTHPNGGALAVIGHVERAWETSFIWPGAGAQIGVYESLIHGLQSGLPVGAAVEHLNNRYAELATLLGDTLERARRGGNVPAENIVHLWTAHHDARAYAVIGDPATRISR